MYKKLITISLFVLSAMSPIFVSARYDNREDRDRPNLYDRNVDASRRDLDERGTRFYQQDGYFYSQPQVIQPAPQYYNQQPQYYQTQPQQQYYIPQTQPQQQYYIPQNR